MPTSPQPSRAIAASAAFHAGLLLLLTAHLAHPPRIAEIKIPGTAHGNTLLTYYAPGTLIPQKGGGPPTPTHAAKAVTAPNPIAKQPAPQPLPQPAASQGTAASAESGLGQGDMRIALPINHPDPAPNLASLKPGSGGDVILDAVIDETGHITKLTVLNSLGPTIDQNVIATVQGWLFTPATLDGKPVPSGQELHFHYQRKDTAA